MVLNGRPVTCLLRACWPNGFVVFNKIDAAMWNPMLTAREAKVRCGARTGGKTRRRRFLQYGLAHLLLLTLVVAVACSWVAVRRHQIQIQHESLARLREIAFVRVSPLEKLTRWQRWTQHLLGEDAYLQVGVSFGEQDLRGRNLDALEGLRYTSHVDVGFLNDRFDKGELKHLVPVRNLKTLLLAGAGVTDSDLVWLENHTELTMLWLAGTSITDRGLHHLRNMRSLEHLVLDGAPGIHGEGLRWLAGLRRLEYIWFNATSLRDETLEYLEALPQLRAVHFTASKVTAEGVRGLVENTRLETIACPGLLTERQAQELSKLRPGVVVTTHSW